MMKTSNAMFHVKHTLGALVLGCVLVAPHAEAATPRTDDEGCKAVSMFVLNVARDRDNGTPALDAKATVAGWDVNGKAKFALYSIIDQVYAYPRSAPANEAQAALTLCRSGAANL